MPKEAETKIRKQGGVKRWRTLKLPSGRYMHIAVTRDKGPRGGQTVGGEVKEKKIDGD